MSGQLFQTPMEAEPRGRRAISMGPGYGGAERATSVRRRLEASPTTRSPKAKRSGVYVQPQPTPFVTMTDQEQTNQILQNKMAIEALHT